VSSACGPGEADEEVDAVRQPAIGSTGDPNPNVTFTQVGRTVGLDRSNEPSSAGAFNGSGTIAYGGWLADLDGDGRLDFYAVNHGQSPHLSGLFLNSGTGGFGENLFTVSLQGSTANAPNFGNSNEMRFIGDLTGDGRVDLFFIGWTGLGVMCVNQGTAVHSDWSGPSYLCYGSSDAIAFSDVNGDGKIDVLGFDLTNFDSYTSYYSQTAPFLWRLNNGDPNIANWPTTTNFLSLRVTDPSAEVAPFCDLNNDGIPDKIVGIPLAPGSRGQNATSLGGQQVFLGQAGGSYTLKSATGLESVTAPITRIEDINEDGCMDIGTDITGYRDNQTWYVQNKTGTTCNVTFTAIARTALPYYPGFKRYNVDVDNSGVLSKAVIIHKAYGNNDGRPAGVSIYRKQTSGVYSVLTPTQSGINSLGIDTVEFYADNLSPGDWNDDGKLDLGGSGDPSIANSDNGFALWQSNLTTTNSWIKLTLPSVTGFFAGSATIEVFDAGSVGDATHLVTPAKVLYPGKAWATQVYHFGIGTRSAVDVRVTFPDGRQFTRTNVTPASRVTILPTNNQVPTAVAFATPASAAIGQPVSFNGGGSSDPDGTIASYAWDFGDGAHATGITAAHAYGAAGTFLARLTVIDNGGSSATTTVSIHVADTIAPTIAITSSVFTPTVADNLGVARVDWYLDGTLSVSATAPPFSYTLPLASLTGGHTLAARAFDAAGNMTSSTPVMIQK
jgi:chitodextrinase